MTCARTASTRLIARCATKALWQYRELVGLASVDVQAVQLITALYALVVRLGSIFTTVHVINVPSSAASVMKMDALVASKVTAGALIASVLENVTKTAENASMDNPLIVLNAINNTTSIAPLTSASLKISAPNTKIAPAAQLDQDL